MGVITEVFPQCDKCFETYNDALYRSVSECRKAMKEQGWKLGKEDVCPDCQAIFNQPKTHEQ